MLVSNKWLSIILYLFSSLDIIQIFELEFVLESRNCLKQAGTNVREITPERKIEDITLIERSEKSSAKFPVIKKKGVKTMIVVKAELIVDDFT